MKKVTTILGYRFSKVVVYWNSEWKEFIVRPYSDQGKPLGANFDYFTDDKQDAINTAEAMQVGGQIS